MLVPPIVRRREMDRRLVRFFNDHRRAAFRRAISEFCRYYSVKPPRIEWYEYIDWGKTAGKTFEDGRIHLVHPENWKRGRVYYSERMWVQTVYHELAHYLFWADAERKAEAFAQQMVRGLKRAMRQNRGASSARRATAKGMRGTRPGIRRTARLRGAVARVRARRRKSIAPFGRGPRRTARVKRSSYAIQRGIG
jgi:predicted SprT family Zn-dependent metalloprotease